jgi:hypothetical protein
MKLKRLFGSVVVVAFQNTFRVKIHQNDVFSFLKSTHQNIYKKLIFSKIK